ncbi:prolyl oligopeptidase family serine peptidase [Nocardia sp. CDC159]|uniref:Prolyl oligopeptidase family serine peptidase n=1 Tax=Nocardia pulmonis TaxID=2951408 RepID=A0A9X2E7A0_9NOCA|nr:MULTISPECIES: prolyl oligopeptidase family serine peptidase [Nocardia]MCM6775084.1 prolyl oligopeptidase family serine peptidase [Nocardia pulmonis]MCM6789554.1 prolyl oligopeptidase family serine peptidase [Nocardia sp. CDC159]
MVGRTASGVITAMVVLMVGVATACGRSTPTATDEFQWLEDNDSPRVHQWVEAENAKTLEVLQKDPRYADNLAQAKDVGNSPDRLAEPTIIHGEIYNFWQDPDHKQGIWRKTSVANYESPQPQWTTVLDVDALASGEGKKWVWKGADCAPVAETRCLVALSEGGEDAVTVREFDLTTNGFVPDGFVLPRGKQDIAWLDDNSLLVGREWQPGELTSSGYAYVVKQWDRGRPLETAVEVGRGEPSDVSTRPVVLTDGENHRLALLDRSPSFFEHEYRLVADGTRPVALPPKADLQGMVANRVLVSLQQDWSVDGTNFPAGTLVALDADALARDPAHPKPTAVYTPGPADALEQVMTTRDQVVVLSLHDVRGRATIYHPGPDGSWTSAPVALPDNATLSATAADDHGSLSYLTVTSFLSPPALWRLDTATGALAEVKNVPPQFDSTGLTVDQWKATSADGTQVPYFVVHRADMPFDGTAPTILHAYGGFGASMTPSYSADLGRLWLARGGAFALANIRGGGEFGPSWHDAALTTDRQRAFDDFAAVGRDLIDRKITAPRHLGISGASNGGLLTGVELTQHPELWNAVDIGVPLLDMLRYQQIAAGASWVGEYGSVDDPAQRAFLARISPYQQLKAGVRYPEPFIWTTTKDDRVGPQHARKFAAKLGALGDPYLYFESSEGGHGSGANIDESALTTALRYTYFMRRLM